MVVTVMCVTETEAVTAATGDDQEARTLSVCVFGRADKVVQPVRRSPRDATCRIASGDCRTFLASAVLHGCSPDGLLRHCAALSASGTQEISPGVHSASLAHLVGSQEFVAVGCTFTF